MSSKYVTQAQIDVALGDLSGISGVLKAALTHRIDESFDILEKPTGGDWLNSHKEAGESFKSFENRTYKAIPYSTFKTIYIQPFDSFDSPRAPSLQTLSLFVKTFFSGTDVEILPTLPLSDTMEHRINEWTRQIQYKTTAFFDVLKATAAKRNLRKQLVCVAVTMADLYPEDSWNFVYGFASSKSPVGVYSFARLDPIFLSNSERLKRKAPDEKTQIVILRRSVKIRLHELGHLFGLAHCIFYSCLMNGMNHENEMDRQPMLLCPVCLRKIYSTFQFNIRDMYASFARLCADHQLVEEAEWYQKRLANL